MRELDLEINGKEVDVVKKTAQKWRKPRGQSEEVFDGNVTTYAVDGFDIKQKQFTEWQESIADPDVLLMFKCQTVFEYRAEIHVRSTENSGTYVWV